MFRSIRTVAVYVTNLDRARKFYTEILGFELSAQVEPNLCFLKSKSDQIHIYLESGMKATSVDRNTSRLSFFLECEKSAFQTYAVLKTAGVRLLQEAPEQVGDDTYCFQFEDPDGNIIEVAGKP